MCFLLLLIAPVSRDGQRWLSWPRTTDWGDEGGSRTVGFSGKRRTLLVKLLLQGVTCCILGSELCPCLFLTFLCIHYFWKSTAESVFPARFCNSWMQHFPAQFSFTLFSRVVGAVTQTLTFKCVLTCESIPERWCISSWMATSAECKGRVMDYKSVCFLLI